MDRGILLEYYLNKYIVPQYNLFERIDVVCIKDVKDERIEVEVLIVTDSEKFNSKFNLNKKKLLPRTIDENA